MKYFPQIMLVLFMSICIGCQKESTTAGVNDESGSNAGGSEVTKVVDQIVEASCGQCQFGMKGKKGCDLAIRIDGKGYYVDGSSMDEHGDAHSENGMCNCIRQAKVTGEVKDGRFVSTSFELLPAENSDDGHGDKKKNHDHDSHDH